MILVIFWKLLLQSHKYSPVRIYEYIALEDLNIINQKNCLDVGGGEKSNYKRFLPHNTESVNIESSGLKPTHTVHNYDWKLKHKYDCVVCLNVLEHVYEYKEMIKAIHTASNKGALIVVATPFVHKIHSSPFDYWRYSEDTLHKLFSEFSSTTIRPAGSGLFLVQYSNMYGLFPKVTRWFFACSAYTLDKLLCAVSPRYKKNCGEVAFPIGYITVVRK